MASLCPRCGTNERTLESVGVFRCPACGRVNADGELIPDGATEPVRFSVSTGAASFAAPPPAAPLAASTQPPFPRAAVVTMAAQAFVTLLMFAGGAPLFGTVWRSGCLVGLLLGHRDAYRAACGGWFLAILGDFYLMTLWFPVFGLIGRGLLLVALVLDATFLAVLLGKDMRQRYERASEA